MDIYDEQIAHLTADPRMIVNDWAKGKGLFKMIGYASVDTGEESINRGCLTQIKFYNGKDESFGKVKAIIKGEVDEELTKEIVEDDRIPKIPADITVAHLPVFAEWQRKIDALQNA